MRGYRDHPGTMRLLPFAAATGKAFLTLKRHLDDVPDSSNDGSIMAGTLREWPHTCLGIGQTRCARL
jgi:hypothetical protein